MIYNFTHSENKNLNRLTISVALHYWQTLPKVGIESVDRINVMTYDMISQNEKKHSTLQNSIAVISNMNFQSNIPYEKMLLGIPAYSRGLKDPAFVLTYQEIVDKFHPQPHQNTINKYPKGINFNFIYTCIYYIACTRIYITNVINFFIN